MYEFAHRAELYKHTRPSFVKADHADDVGFMFGGCFWAGGIKVIGTFNLLPKICTCMHQYELNVGCDHFTSVLWIQLRKRNEPDDG